MQLCGKITAIMQLRSAECMSCEGFHFPVSLHCLDSDSPCLGCIPKTARFWTAAVREKFVGLPVPLLVAKTGMLLIGSLL